MNDVLEFLVEKVVPLMVSKLDFKNEALKVDVNENAYFINSREAGKEFAVAYNIALQELETQCKQKLDLLTAKSKAIRDIVKQMEFRNKKKEYNEEIKNLKIKQEETDKELAKVTNEYKIIQNAISYVLNVLNTELYKVVL